MRTVFVIGPDKKIKLMLSYPMTTGRNFDEILRVLDSMQLTAKHKVATPVNWKSGDDVIIVPVGLGRRSEAEVSRRLEDAEALPARRRPTEVAVRAASGPPLLRPQHELIPIHILKDRERTPIRFLRLHAKRNALRLHLPRRALHVI